MGEKLKENNNGVLLFSAAASVIRRASILSQLLDSRITVLGPIEFREVGVILARTEPGNHEFFQFIRSFSQIVWLLIFVSILMNSLFNSITTSSPRKLFAYFWNYLEILFSKSIQRLLVKTKSKLILGIWILSCYYFAIGFTSFMMDFMIRAVPLIKMNSISDLVKRRDILVYARYGSPFAEYIHTIDNELTKSLRNRLITFNDFNEVVDDLAFGLKNGTAAFSYSRNSLWFQFIELQEKLWKNHREQFSDNLYASENSFGIVPNFLIFNAETDEKILDVFNKM